MNRRDLLRRIPAVPFVIGAAASQMGNVLQTTGGRFVTPLAVSAPEEETLAQRLVWFENTLQYVSKPTLPKPETIEELGPAMMRAAAQWQAYADAIVRQAQSYNIPLEEAERIVGIALT